MASVGERELLKLKHDGWESDLIDYRLQHEALSTTIKVLTPLVGLERVHPHYLPTQKSGRWSTTNPNLPGFSADCINPYCSRAGEEHRSGGSACWSTRDVIIPDPGNYFIKWDWEAIEAKLAAAYSGDDEDLDLFARKADIHTVTYCKMFGLPLPPDVMNPYKAASCEEWRHVTGLTDKDCWQRASAKCCRYSLAYGADHRGINEAKDVDKLARLAGLDKAGVEAMAKAYLDSKPKLKAWKYRVWDEIMLTQEVRTPLGRRKRLFISEEEYIQWRRTRRATKSQKEGLNHLAQGMVASMMNRTIIAIKHRFPPSRLCYQAHDGLVMSFPESLNPWPEIREIVERDWETGNGRTIKSTADWQLIREDGSHEELR